MPAPWRYRKPGGNPCIYIVQDDLFIYNIRKATRFIKNNLPGIVHRFADAFNLEVIGVIKDNDKDR